MNIFSVKYIKSLGHNPKPIKKHGFSGKRYYCDKCNLSFHIHKPGGNCFSKGLIVAWFTMISPTNELNDEESSDFGIDDIITCDEAIIKSII